MKPITRSATLLNSPIRNRSSGWVFLLVLAVLILASAVPGLAATEESPRSFSLTGQDKQLDQVPVKRLPKVEAELLRAEEREGSKNPQHPAPYRFAVAADVALTLRNSGSWQTLADGRLWRLRLQSPGAVSHNLAITRFDMPAGAKLWIYDPKHTRVEGPYTARDRSPAGSLWTPVIEGDEIVLEVFVPSGVSLPDLEITRVNQGFRGFDSFDKGIPGGGVPGPCENDVICPVGAPWADQTHAVGVVSILGSFFCSGTRLNNVLARQYFLSADHCFDPTVTGVSRSAGAASVVVYWNYESTSCGAHTSSMYDTESGGGALLADYVPSDFALLELSGTLPSIIYHAGWDATSAAPTATVGIHHPRGGVKSISFSNSAPTGAVWPSGAASPTGDHWRANWDSGVTEPGSSGSCLFSATTKRCIGQLHGGPSACGGTDLWDYYGKFSASWYGGGTAASRLKDWLDPFNTGITGMDGDPHVTTVAGIHYDFQGAGEYVALRDVDGTEIQTRSLPVSTTAPWPDAYDGLKTCVSIDTAVATKVGNHRITIEPNLSGVPDPSALQVRVDGVLTTLGIGALHVGAGRMVRGPAPNGYEIDFPNGTALYVTPTYWPAQSTWYLNVDVFRNPASEGLDGSGSGGGGAPDIGGIMAPLAPGSWLPVLPDGTSLGSLPGAFHQRYVELYQKFGGAWRVGAKSLFDYAPGTSTATFTQAGWPPEHPPCILPKTPIAKPLDGAAAEELCRSIVDRDLNANCVSDVTVTGEPGFADLFLWTQKIRTGATFTTVSDLDGPTAAGETATFTAVVTPRGANGDALPAGTVQFLIDDKEVGEPVPLDSNGQATWKAPDLEPGDHQVTARYIAKEGGFFLDSSSFDYTHTVSK